MTMNGAGKTLNRHERRRNEKLTRVRPVPFFRCAIEKEGGGVCGAQCKSEKLGKLTIVTHALPHCAGYLAMPLPDWMRRGDVP